VPAVCGGNLPLRRARAAQLRKFRAGEAGRQIPRGDGARPVHCRLLARKRDVRRRAGVALANEKLAAEKSPLKLQLSLIGAFASSEDKAELDDLMQRAAARGRDIPALCPRNRKSGHCAPRICFASRLIIRRRIFRTAWWKRWRLPADCHHALAGGCRDVPPNYPDWWIRGRRNRWRKCCCGDRLRHGRNAARDVVNGFTIEQHLANMARAIRSVEVPEPRRRPCPCRRCPENVPRACATSFRPERGWVADQPQRVAVEKAPELAGVPRLIRCVEPSRAPRRRRNCLSLRLRGVFPWCPVQ